MDPRVRLHAERIALTARREYIAQVTAALAVDANAMSERLGAIAAELSRLDAEDARLAAAKAEHDREVEALHPAERAMEQVRQSDAAFTLEELARMDPRPTTLTPEEEGGAAARTNGEPVAARLDVGAIMEEILSKGGPLP